MVKLPTAREDGRHDCHLEVSEEAGSVVYVRGCPIYFFSIFQNAYMNILLYNRKNNKIY